jgi:VanZ family protein
MFLRYILPGILWAIIIMILLALPPNDLPKSSFLNIPHLDKIVHFILFFVLALLLAGGFSKQVQFSFFNTSPLLIAMLIAIAYGGLTELLQGSLFVGRTSEFLDFAADCVGALIGIGAMKIVKS